MMVSMVSGLGYPKIISSGNMSMGNPQLNEGFKLMGKSNFNMEDYWE